MAGYYLLKKSKNDQFYFLLKAGNHEIILNSEMYSTKGAAENGIASVQTNSPLDERYDRKNSTAGQPYFNLKAANHQVIGTSEMYSSEAARDKGIESVKTNGPSTDVRDESA
jgi:uncharacterized protein YegP (UPF0339 family)